MLSYLRLKNCYYGLKQKFMFQDKLLKMKKELRKHFFLCALFPFLFVLGLKAQVAIPVAGSEATGNGGSISYTIGQLINTKNTGANGSLLHGVQQPFEISILSGLKDNGIELMFNIYPNPTTENLILNISDNSNDENLHYQLYDLKGVILASNKIQGTQIIVPLNNYLPSTYFIRIMKSKDGILGQELKVFKIIKK